MGIIKKTIRRKEMADNIFFTEAKDNVLKLIAKEFPTMPEKFVSVLISNFYKFSSYEEEGQKMMMKRDLILV